MKHTLIGIVDDHQLFTNALSSLVNSTDKYEVILTASSGAEFKRRLQSAETLPRLILMDVNLGDTTGVIETQWCKEHYPQILILALSMDSDSKTILQMIRAGACGYMLKDIDPTQFVFALDTVINHGYYHSDLVSKALVQSLHTEKKIDLKENEQIFLENACSDMTYKEIANKMFLSPKTIDKYREALFKKFEVKSRVGLALYAIKKGYVQL